MAVRIEGEIPYGEVGTVSMRHGTQQVIEPGAFDKSLEEGADVFLLNGRDYGATLATVGTGTLVVESTPEALRFKTKGRLPETDALRDATTRIKSGLTAGVAPGFVPIKSEVVDGVEVVLEGMLCEIYSLSRPVFASASIRAFGRGGRRF